MILKLREYVLSPVVSYKNVESAIYNNKLLELICDFLLNSLQTADNWNTFLL